MCESDIGQAVALIGRAMNVDEGGYAAQTLHFHFSCQRRGIDDGRSCSVLADGEKVIGLAGLHHYCWGPPENVWLSWFALDPALHGQGLAAAMIAAIEDQARRRGHQRLFIETYSTPEFARARSFYNAQGFAEAAAIPGWLPSGGAMVVYSKTLPPLSNS